MRREERLVSRLARYNQTDMYPFHMPGHKRLKWEAAHNAQEMEFQTRLPSISRRLTVLTTCTHPEGILRIPWRGGRGLRRRGPITW